MDEDEAQETKIKEVVEFENEIPGHYRDVQR
jgi:hypothetical protein